MESWERILRACNQNLGGRTAESWHEERRHFAIPRPPWAGTDPLYADLARDQETLFRRGTVVPACFVRAHDNMKRVAPADVPGDVVWSFDPRLAADLDDLSSIAEDLEDSVEYGSGDEDEEALAQSLRAGTVRLHAKELPPSLSGEFEVLISSVLLVRNHVPGGFLADRHVPLLVAPGEARTAMVLPARYWPDELVREWQAVESGPPCPDHDAIVIKGYAWPVPVIACATLLVTQLSARAVSGNERVYHDQPWLPALGVAIVGGALLAFARFESRRGPRRYRETDCGHPIDVTYDRRILFLGPRAWGWMLVGAGLFAAAVQWAVSA